jgi:hypothetical protein
MTDGDKDKRLEMLYKEAEEPLLTLLDIVARYVDRDINDLYDLEIVEKKTGINNVNSIEIKERSWIWLKYKTVQWFARLIDLLEHFDDFEGPRDFINFILENRLPPY